MTREPLSSDEFEQKSNEIDVDSDRAVSYAGFDYNHDWKGFLGESNQNSYDGWCNNRLRNDLPDNTPLNIEIHIYPDKSRIVHRDNAGGMREEQFRVYTNLNEPGEDKRKFASGGDQGRGFHVLAQLGEIVQVETYNPQYRGGVEVRHNERVFRDFNQLDEYGTEIEIRNCDPDEMEKLADIEKLESYLRSRFQKMLEDNRVTVQVTIHHDDKDESKVIAPIDLNQFEVLYGPEDLSFEFRGQDYTLKDFVIYERGGKDVPFGCIEMYKDHEAEGEPFMRVKSYRPRRLSNVDKIFAFCDASSLREFETGGHTDYKYDIHTEAPLRETLADVLDDEFGSEPIDTAEFDEIRQMARDLFNDNVELDLFDNRIEADLETGVAADESNPKETVDEEGDHPGDKRNGDGEGVGLDRWLTPEDNDGEEETEEIEEDPTPSLRCEIVEGREIEEGEPVHIRPVVENPPGSDTSELSVRGEIEEANGDTTIDLDNLIMDVPEGKGDSGNGWEFNPPEDVSGRLVFRGEVYEKGGRTNVLDKTNTWFYVGESAPTNAPSGSPFKEILYTKRESDEHRYVINEVDNGLILYVNALHPEFRTASDKDGKEGIEHRAELTFEYMMESAYQTIAEQAIQDRLGDIPVPDDDRYDNAADVVSDLITNEMIRRIDRTLGSYYA